MSKMKKMMSLLLAVVMVLSMMTVNVFAADGTITINNAQPGETYTIYKVFDLETYIDNKYSYKVVDKWKSLFVEGGVGDDYITVDADGYIKTAIGEGDTAEAAALAELLANNLTGKDNAGSKQASGATVEFTGLQLGYYLVTSTYGSSGICALTTTDTQGVVYDKNTVPSISKFVKEDDASGESAWGEKNDADRGQEVEFKISVKTEKDASGYVITDTLADGLKLDKSSIVVTVKGTPFSLTPENSVIDDNGFEIKLGTLVCDVNDEIIITYKATVDSDATTKTALVNTATLTYDSGKKLEKTTSTYTWEIPVYKFYKNGENKVNLPGAKFVLKNAGGKYCKITDGVISWTTNSVEATEFTSAENGEFVIKGLDSGKYYLEEKEAPAGYNKLTADIEVDVDSEGKIEVDSAEVAKVEVENKTGSILPETGGIGTTIFRVGGAALIIAAGALLIAKKRTNNI